MSVLHFYFEGRAHHVTYYWLVQLRLWRTLAEEYNYKLNDNGTYPTVDHYVMHDWKILVSLIRAILPFTSLHPQLENLLLTNYIEQKAKDQLQSFRRVQDRTNYYKIIKQSNRTIVMPQLRMLVDLFDKKPEVSKIACGDNLPQEVYDSIHTFAKSYNYAEYLKSVPIDWRQMLEQFTTPIVPILIDFSKVDPSWTRVYAEKYKKRTRITPKTKKAWLWMPMPQPKHIILGKLLSAYSDADYTRWEQLHSAYNSFYAKIGEGTLKKILPSFYEVHKQLLPLNESILCE